MEHTPSSDQKPAETGSAVAKSNQKMFLIGALSFLAIVLVALLGAGIYRVYAKAAQDKFTVAVATMLRLPVGQINGERVLYRDYAADMKAIHTMQGYDAASGGAPTLTEEQMSDQVLLRLANNVLVRQAAKEHGIKVEDADIQAIRDQVNSQFASPAEVDAELMKRYGWTMDTYVEKVIKPFVMQNKLADKISADPASREQIRQTAEGVLQQIKDGGDFAELAKQYGSDGTAQNGGDLGFFARGVMVPQFETAAFALKKGELSPTLVETQYGYHIVKVTDKKTTKEKDETGKTVDKEEVKASHILFAFPTVDKYLDKKFMEARKSLYLNVHNPFMAPTTPVAQ